MPRRPHHPSPLELAQVAGEHALGVAMLLAGLVVGAFLRDLGGRLPPLSDVETWLRDGSSLLAQFAHRFRGRFVPLHEYVAWNIVATAALQYAMFLHGLYDRQAVRRSRNELLRLLQSAGLALLAVTVVFFFVRPPELGRTALLIGYSLTVLLLWGLRSAARRARASRVEQLVILGGGPAALEVVSAIASSDERAQVLGVVGGPGPPPPGLASLGAWDDLASILQRETVHRVLLAEPPPPGWDPAPVVSARLEGIAVASAREFAENLTGEVHEDDPGVEFLTDATSRAYGRISRLTDVLMSVALLAVTAPLLAVAALLVLVTSGRPVLFVQERVGLGGRRFRCLKLRTMTRDAEASGPAWSPTDDPRVTPLGRVLRRFRIDELPQLVNVLRGDMAFVGPRAEQPFFVERLKAELPRYDLRHLVRPGLTGWAQVRSRYGSSNEDARRKLRFDLFYVKHRSPTLDLSILFDTVRVVLRGEGR